MSDIDYYHPQEVEEKVFEEGWAEPGKKIPMSFEEILTKIILKDASPSLRKWHLKREALSRT